MRMSSGSPGTGQAPTGTCRISSTAARYLTYKRPMPIDGFQAICPPIVKYMLTAVASLRRLPTAILTQASVSASPAADMGGGSTSACLLQVRSELAFLCGEALRASDSAGVEGQAGRGLPAIRGRGDHERFSGLASEAPCRRLVAAAPPVAGGGAGHSIP